LEGGHDLEGGEDIEVMDMDTVARNKNILESEFQGIKTNWLVLLIDPVLRSLFCGYSPFSCCSRFRDQHRALEKVEEKFIRELDAKIML
jgi:hypothetical protein